MKRDAWTRRSPAWLEPLSVEECMQLLRDHSVGRISVTVDGGPFIMPVNYRLDESSQSASTARRPRCFSAPHTDDFAAPEIPVTQTTPTQG